MAFQPRDHYFKRAKAEGFLARSAYKLQDLQKRYKVLKKGDRVLDLGCAPGSWSQVALNIIGPDGYLVGVDLQGTSLRAANARFLQSDILRLNLEELGGDRFDVVLSDMAPLTSGIKIRDQSLSEELCLKVLEIGNQFLKPKANLVMKLFEGSGAKSIEESMRSAFAEVRRIKPEAVRPGSIETYLVGLRFRPHQERK